MEKFKFFIVADPHYFAKSLHAEGREYEEFMDYEQKCFAETAAINDSVFEYLKNSRDADTVIFTGDLSFNGEKESHREFSRKLADLKNCGKDIYVVTAGHDIEPNPFEYDKDEGRRPVEGVKFRDLYDYYRDFGYDQSISFYKETLSYVAQISDSIRLLVLCNDSEEGKNLKYSDDMMKWAKEQCKKARDENQMMIALEHYPLLPGQPIFSFIPDARQKDSRSVINMLADGGVHVAFTGHMHNQSINVTRSDNGNIFYDVSSGSIIGYPAYLRLVTIEDEHSVKIESVEIPEFNWDKRGKSGREYMKDQFERMIRSMVNSMKTDPKKLLSRFGAGDKNFLFPIVKMFGNVLSSWRVGSVARLLFVKADDSLKDAPLIELIVDLVRCVFEGDQPYTEDAPAGDTILKIFKRFNPLWKILNKKIKGSQGESLDFYDMLKNTIGNYGISDYNAELKI